jgi:hypothetical protein
MIFSKMVPSNVIQRVFFLRSGDYTATGFALDVEKKQYLVTAKHFAENVSALNHLQIFHDRTWKTFEVQLVGHAAGEIDISVLAPSELLAHPNLLLIPTNEVYYSQDVYFVGFPYGWWGEAGKINFDFPLPFVKKAVVSCIEFGPNGEVRNFLDGHNNPGFSGSPVVFQSFTDRESFHVTSVISGYRYVDEPVYLEGKSGGSYQYNTGIIVSYGIKHAIDLAVANPIGPDAVA